MLQSAASSTLVGIVERVGVDSAIAIADDASLLPTRDSCASFRPCQTRARSIGGGNLRVSLARFRLHEGEFTYAADWVSFSFRPSKGIYMPASRDDLLQGTLDMLVLKALQLGQMHGWGITERLEQGSRGVFQLNQGSLYPALYRLERQGLVTSSWKTTEHNRRARYYGLTAAGRRALAAEQEKWERQSQAVNLVLRMS